MNAIDALAPTLAMIHRAAAAAAQKDSRKLADEQSHEFVRCKYVIVENDSGEHCPILFDHRLQHRDLVPPHLTPVRAAFIMFCDGLIITPNIPSTSLNLGPKPEDKDIITKFLNQ